MRDKYNRQLRQLNLEMVQMGHMIQRAIQDTVEAFFSQDVEKAKQIMEDDELVDEAQKKIENICFQLLIQQQPVARDLRMITAAMKMVTDMERIGDHASDISELTIMMAQCPSLPIADSIRRMSIETIMMLLNAIEAYVDKNMAKAKAVITQDDTVDELFVKVKKELIEVMQNSPEHAEYAADLLMVNKYLERIGDHATNIAEWVIFSLDNKIKKED